jgi:Zn-dependent protease
MMEGFDPLWIGINIIVLLFSVSLHESAHAWMAEKRGDPTGRLMGRISMNPLRHADLVGSFLVPMIGVFTGAPVFGWAKPVPVNSAYLRDFRRDQLFIAAAGPVSNLMAAAGFLLVYKVLSFSGFILGMIPGIIAGPLILLCQVGILLNIILAVFNLIPVPPLDGSWVLIGILPPNLAVYVDKIRPYGFGILILLLMTGGIGYILRPVLDSVMFLIR